MMVDLVGDEFDYLGYDDGVGVGAVVDVGAGVAGVAVGAAGVAAAVDDVVVVGGGGDDDGVGWMMIVSLHD
jgi:hypothetical protein